MPCKMSHARLCRLSRFSLCGPGFVRRPRNVVTACNNLGCPAVLLVLRLDKASSASTVLRRPIRLRCFDGLQALAFPPN